MKNNKNKNKQLTKDQQLAKAYAKRQRQGVQGPMQIGGSVLGGLGGFVLGGPMGAAAGSAIGGAVGNAAGYYTGTGDYRVQQNAVMNANFKNNTGTVITHREYITDVYSGTLSGGSTSFDIAKYPINPGVTTTFPWLASIAANYEEYEILGMVFSFIATSGESVASTNTALGTVILATEYDPTKPAFANKQAMENYQFSSSAKPSVSQVHAIECKKSLTPVKMLYVRSGDVVANDLRWSDFANFYIATVGHPAAGVNLGELWCTYKIKLNKPRLPITIGLGGQLASGYLQRAGSTTAAPGGNAQLSSKGTIALTVTPAGVLSFAANPNMNYLVTVNMFAATSASIVSQSTTANCLPLLFYNSGVSASYSAGATTQNSTSTLAIQCSSTDTDSRVSVAFGCTLVGAATVEVIVVQVDETLN